MVVPFRITLCSILVALMVSGSARANEKVHASPEMELLYSGGECRLPMTPESEGASTYRYETVFPPSGNNLTVAASYNVPINETHTVFLNVLKDTPAPSPTDLYSRPRPTATAYLVSHKGSTLTRIHLTAAIPVGVYCIVAGTNYKNAVSEHSITVRKGFRRLYVLEGNDKPEWAQEYYKQFCDFVKGNKR